MGRKYRFIEKRFGKPLIGRGEEELRDNDQLTVNWDESFLSTAPKQLQVLQLAVLLHSVVANS